MHLSQYGFMCLLIFMCIEKGGKSILPLPNAQLCEGPDRISATNTHTRLCKPAYSQAFAFNRDAHEIPSSKLRLGVRARSEISPFSSSL